MNSVLFLDIDGVLNTKWSKTLYSLSRPRMTRLRQIIKDTGCKIVLSSTWRKDAEAIRRLKRAKIPIYDMTIDMGGLPITDPDHRYFRGHEIQEWLDRHPEVINYCIVDDDSDMLDSQLRNFVQTTYEHGMTESHAHRITYILNNGTQNIK